MYSIYENSCCPWFWGILDSRSVEDIRFKWIYKNWKKTDVWDNVKCQIWSWRTWSTFLDAGQLSGGELCGFSPLCLLQMLILWRCMYSYPLSASTAVLPTTHQCCYLWWPTFGPSDWTKQPITGQSDSSAAVEGQTPPIRGHRRGLTDRQAKGWCFGAGVSSLFVQIHLRDTDTGVKLDTNTTMQDFSDRNSYLYPIIFVVFLIELEGICCAGSKSRVTLMSFQFCN